MTDARTSLAARLLPKLIASLAFAGAFVLLLSRTGTPLVPPWDALRAVPVSAFVVNILLVGLTSFLRAARFRHLVAPVKRLPLRDVLLVNWVGFFAIFALPLRLGEAVRPALTKLRNGVPLSVGVGTIAVERVVDGLVTSLCVAVALFALPMRATTDPIARHLPIYAKSALLLFSCAFLALFVFLWQRELASRLLRTVVGWVSPRVAEFLAVKVASVADGMRTLRDPRLSAAFLGETLLYWAVNALSMGQLAVACGIPIGPGEAVGIMGVLAIGILLPAGPGMFGSFQLAVFAGLRCYVDEATVRSAGAVYVFSLYAIQTLVYGGLGLLSLQGMNLGLRDVLETPADASENLPTAP